MEQLPIFPLNTVLFPGMPLRLHIFEPRYKKMFQDCIAEGTPFGVALIVRGREAHGPLPEPHKVGCTASISSMEPLEDGRTNVLAVGEDRFRIRDLHRERAYLQAEVDWIEMDPLDAPLQDLTDYLSLKLPEYRRHLRALGIGEGKSTRIPTQPDQLGYLCAGLLRIPLVEKQSLLAEQKLERLLYRLSTHFRRELAVLEPLAKRGPERLNATFPLN